jgi:hypothetical protein
MTAPLHNTPNKLNIVHRLSNISGKAVPVYTTKSYGENQLYAPAIVLPDSDPPVPLLGDWVESRVGLDVSLTPVGNRTTIPRFPSPCPTQYTDTATPAVIQ